MYSQRDEELYIINYFKDIKNGRFLDIGAYEGKTFSNTHKLAKDGWSGVCVEPSPSVFPALEKLYESNENIICINKAVGNIQGFISFYDSQGDAVSSTDEKHVKLWSDNYGSKFKKIQVLCTTVKSLLDEYGYDFNFVNIDTEGTSFDILNDLPFDKLANLSMICIEYDKKQKEILSVANKYSFRLLKTTAENLILVK